MDRTHKSTSLHRSDLHLYIQDLANVALSWSTPTRTHHMIYIIRPTAACSIRTSRINSSRDALWTVACNMFPFLSLHPQPVTPATPASQGTSGHSPEPRA